MQTTMFFPCISHQCVYPAINFKRIQKQIDMHRKSTPTNEKSQQKLSQTTSFYLAIKLDRQ